MVCNRVYLIQVNDLTTLLIKHGQVLASSGLQAQHRRIVCLFGVGMAARVFDAQSAITVANEGCPLLVQQLDPMGNLHIVLGPRTVVFT